MPTADYFEAGTQVVWDLDVKARVVRSYPGRIAHGARGICGGAICRLRIILR